MPVECLGNNQTIQVRTRRSFEALQASKIQRWPGLEREVADAKRLHLAAGLREKRFGGSQVAADAVSARHAGFDERIRAALVAVHCVAQAEMSGVFYVQQFAPRAHFP